MEHDYERRVASPFGVKYIVRGALRCPGGRSADVVAVYRGTDGVEVEFFHADGGTKAVITLGAADLRWVRISNVVSVQSSRRSA